jgi:hypothetical protein
MVFRRVDISSGISEGNHILAAEEFAAPTIWEIVHLAKFSTVSTQDRASA